MNHNYRVDWQAGMQLSDQVFRAADDYYLSCLRPLYATLVNGDYGFCDLPIFRYELSDSDVSVTELRANAITASGKLIRLDYVKGQRMLFQHITFPDTTNPVILFIDTTSDKTVKVDEPGVTVPLCDVDYQMIVKLETEHYNNPDAVPLARFVFRHGWSLDPSFIAPCITLRSNGALLRAASNYVVELEALSQALQAVVQTDQHDWVMSVLPLLARTSIEIQKEVDSMTPRHLITLMQEVIQVLSVLSHVVEGVVIPEPQQCVAFIESHYTPYVLGEMIEEGIRLTHLLIGMTKSFSVRTVSTPMPDPLPVPNRPVRRPMDTSSMRKKLGR